MTIKTLLRWQVCWANFLLRFNFVIFYTPGKENGKADSLTHHSNNCLANNNDD